VSPKTGKSSTRALSDFWRQRRGESLEAELGNLLYAARGYAAFFGPRITVDWSGSQTAASDDGHVLLDFAPLDGKPTPFDGADVDRIMGRALQECAKYTWSYPRNDIRDYYRARCRNPQDNQLPGNYSPRELRELETVADIVEDYFVGGRLESRYPALGAYVTEARAQTLDEQLPKTVIEDMGDDDTSFDALVTAWGAHLLNGVPLPEHLSPNAAERLRLMLEMTERARDAAPADRLALAYEIWELMGSLPRAEDKNQSREESQCEAQPDTDSKPDPESDDGGTQDAEKNGRGEHMRNFDKWLREQEQPQPKPAAPEETRLPDHVDLRRCHALDHDPKQPLKPGVKEAVERYLRGSREDITESVSEVFGGRADQTISLEMAEDDPEKARRLEAETRPIAERLRRLFERDKRLRTRARRGLEEGRVSPRRLARAGAHDYHIFERKEILNAPSLAVGILVDASGSMTHERLDRALGIAMALKTALDQVRGADLMVAAYNTDSQFGDYCHRAEYLSGGKSWLNWMLREANCGGTTIYRIYDRRSRGFRAGVQTIGGTPSGEAIAGMVSQIGKYLRGKSRMIIHITDGAPDSDVAVKRAVKYCAERQIDVLTLTLHRLDDAVKDAYGGLVEYVDSAADLPDAVAAMLGKCLDKRLLRV
jgi:hypothetical protein